MDQAVRVVILTALNREFEAVLTHITDPKTVQHSAGTLFEAGRLRDSDGRWIAVGLTGAGNTNAAVLAERAISLFVPQALFFVGIAGAIHDDLNLADVVFASKVYAYHGGRVEDDGLHAAPETWYPPHDLDQVARSIARTKAWHKRLYGAAPSRVYFRPVAAGEVVLNSTKHPLREQLDRSYTDTAAVEMESAGAARAGQLNRSLPTLTIRGISDRADGNKYADDADGHRDRAMVTSAAFAAELASRVSAPVPVPGPAPSPAQDPFKVQNDAGYSGLAFGALYDNTYVHHAPPDVATGRDAAESRLRRPVAMLVDRERESELLKAAVLNAPSPIIVVTGEAGVGKTELVRRVLAEMSAEKRWRVATPLSHPSVRAIIGDIEQAEHQMLSLELGDDESWQGDLEIALHTLGTDPFIIVIDSADHLLGDDRVLLDLALDEALQILSARPGHAVKIILIAERHPVAFGQGDWANKATPIRVKGLPLRFFKQFARERAAGNPRLLGSLDDDRLTDLRWDLGGRPRLVQLFDGAIENGVAADASELAAIVHGWARPDGVQAVYDHLLDAVTRNFKLHRGRIYRAVAALGAPATAAMVAELVNCGRERNDEVSIQLVHDELEALSGTVLYRVGLDRYVLPAVEAERGLDRTSIDRPGQRSPDRKLLLDAASLLRKWRIAPERGGRPDSEAALAEVGALLRGGFVERAHRAIRELDVGARTGSPSMLFRQPREDIAERLTVADRRVDNYNVLGYLHFVKGDLSASRTAYAKVLTAAADLVSAADLAPVEAKARLNLGWVYWSQGLIACAECDFELAHRLAPSDKVVAAGALEGKARCHRRHGRFGEAISTMTAALDAAEPRSPHLLRIAVRLLRLHLDLGHIPEAEKLLPRIRDAASHHRDPALDAVRLDALADLELARNNNALALSTAQRAAELALKAHDPVTALQAQSTICTVRLRQEEWGSAAREAVRAERYAGMDHSLLGTALRAIASRRAGQQDEARVAAQHLLRQASSRGGNDEEDFASWEFVGLAQCTLHLLDGTPIDQAVEAFRRAQHPKREPAQALTDRMEFLIKTLAMNSADKRRLRSAVDALRHPLDPPGSSAVQRS